MPVIRSDIAMSDNNTFDPIGSDYQPIDLFYQGDISNRV